MTAVLDVQNLTVALPGGADRPYAVENLSLTVGKGELVCVVGESGSGKSVTSFTVMGLLPKTLKPTGGRILLEGDDLLTKSPAQMRRMRGKNMAMIFQEPMTALNPVMRVSEQIEEVLEIHSDMSSADRRKRVIEVMEAVHLPDIPRLIDSYPHQLSGGQRQRVMIASALALDPALLIADEPTTALDVTTQAQILKLIKELQVRRNTGVLFITHDFGVVAEIADRVVVMQRGKVVEQGPVQNILQNPREAYTKMLIGSVPSLTPANRPQITDAPIVVETIGLKKIYKMGGFLQAKKEFRAADDINLTVRRGETLGVVGESGSGKSTVARCISRLIDPTEGAIRIEGTDIATVPVSKLRQNRKRIQIVFQDPFRSLNPRMTVGASIVEGPMNFGVSKKDAIERARELMRLVKLDPNALDRFPHQFSGGQRQRICIARALAMEPEILIADEAVSALDVSVQHEVLKLLDEVRVKFNLAVLFITHDLRVAAQICHRIMVMQRGKVVEAGITADVFANPQHPYTKALFDAAPGRNYEFAKFVA
ncbi:glutathione import ATP-binding protein GsiA [Variibacter gotjawalensis]|uniref:Glutathione import ATP-binding protein GsiA n=1 Tax=Variibacter gotjawalensis TaxID=1333996 RepID=A0A0S3PZC7_9BRAD|nr:ABC transporter ATP-binding protein [Variibacter gotjawalensis]NIK47144.1 peptide/nickel transport system ATP-binding protein [Variibacter gotjawalensis]RZS49044.1 peptide/nickel transport system ATP-binding protein [Variibacter gotjawalensis]BAT61306.1 glutathione import ATP-binding protein GsiA [Variibacter gotjawalensis]